DHVVLTALAVLAGGAGRTGRTGRATALRPALSVQVLGHGARGLVQVADRPADRRDVLAAGRLLGPLNGRLDRRLCRLADLLAALLEQLLELVDLRVGLVAGVDQLLLALVLVGVRLGVALHPVDLVLRQAAGALDADRVLLAGALVLGGHAQY